MIPSELFLLLFNPTPPPTPASITVGTPPVTVNPADLSAPTLIAPPPISIATSLIPTIIPPTTPLLIPEVNLPTIPQFVNTVPLRLDRPGNLDASSPGIQSPLSLLTVNSTIPIIDRIPVNFLSNRIRLLDDPFKEEFQAFTGILDEIATLDVNQAQDILQRVTREANTKPVFIYVFFTPEDTTQLGNLRGQINRTASSTDILEVVLVPPKGDLIRVRYPNLNRSQVLQVAQQFRSETSNFRSSRSFLRPAQQIYQWLITPLEEELKKQDINNLVFLMDAGLRSIPLAAMHSGTGFVVENYSIGLMPSLSLTDTTYQSLQGSQVLAMGADTFVNNSALPAVPLELRAVNQLWGGNTLLNENFTLNNLRQSRQPSQRIVHLATHGVFAPGDKANSYVQLWGGERLTLETIRQFGWGNPPVDLLVLSACQTALGDKEAELGFAGLAINTGVRSALASLWRVSDEGTLGLMTEFYRRLQETTTKSEALRQTQLAMLRGQVRLQGGNLVTAQGSMPLNEELRRVGDRSLTHPYFWSSFTLVGNPW